MLPDGRVDIDSWWRAMYMDAKIEPILAMSIAPWIPPSCRGNVVNTEHMKSSKSQAHSSANPAGCPKTLAELIRRGTYNPLDLQSTSAADLHEVCSLVGIPHQQASTKVL